MSANWNTDAGTDMDMDMDADTNTRMGMGMGTGPGPDPGIHPDAGAADRPLFRRLDDAEIARQELHEQRMLGETNLERPKTILGFTASAATYFVSVVLVALVMLFVIFMFVK